MINTIQTKHGRLQKTVQPCYIFEHTFRKVVHTGGQQNIVLMENVILNDIKDVYDNFSHYYGVLTPLNQWWKNM